MEFIDTHCHIQNIGHSVTDEVTFKKWSELNLASNEVIDRAIESGVTQMISVGCTLAESQLAIELSARHKPVFASIGIHPHAARDYKKKKEDLSLLAGEDKVVAVGECGLDYYYDHSPREDQIAVLEKQLEIAINNDLPVIFHVRQAFKDFWPIFDAFTPGGKKIRGVLHSYTDNEKNLQAALSRGLHIGVNGISTFAKNEEQLAVYRAIPLNSLLLETDSPYLTPVPFRGNINEPKYIPVIARFLADLRGENIKEIAEKTTANARTLFGFK